MPKAKVYIENGRLCAEMPALMLDSDGSEFKPMWKMKNSSIFEDDKGRTVVCVPLPKHPTIVRTGRGWGRSGKDQYYYYDGSNVRKLIKRPTKKLYERTWMTCLEDKLGGRWCFELRNGKIVPARLELNP